MKTFAELFKKYRLRAEFETISSFAEALSEKGYFYEESIFSHWQKGNRVPSNRNLVLSIIKIFKERDAINKLDEANELLDSVGLGYLTEKEIKNLEFDQYNNSPFQVPSDIASFIGRKALLVKIQNEIKKGKVIVLHGPPGVGKTSIAIKLGHLLRTVYPDGVFWYKVDSSNEMDILLSIAHLFGEDISGIKDLDVRASVVRTLLIKKKVLFVFDNITKKNRLHLLLPSTNYSGVILSSREKDILFGNNVFSIPITIFTKDEALSLFQKVFDENYTEDNRKKILAICEKVGYLPLALSTIASQIRQFKLTPNQYYAELEDGHFNLRSLRYEDKDLLQAVHIGFTALDSEARNVFVSLGIFEGKDFPSVAVAFINKLSQYKTEQMLQQLVEISFIEPSELGRYRIHPLLKIFAREQIKDASLYLRAAVYYEQHLVVAKEKQSYRSLVKDVDNIIYIFKKCYEYGYWDQIITLWNPLEKFLSDTNEIKKLREMISTIDISPHINILQKLITGYYILLIFYWIILFHSGLKESFWNDFFSLSFTIMPLIPGGIILARTKPWGLFSNNIGKAIFFTALGLLLWGIGNSIWAYYNYFQNNAVPYPSWADAGFGPSYVCFFMSAIYFSFATGSKFGIYKKAKKIFLLIVPLIIISCSYYFLLFVVKRTFSTETPIRIFFDLYYPSMDILTLTTSTIILGLSVNFFGGKYRLSLFSILCAFAFLYVGDFLFSYTTSTNIYYNGGPGDLIFATAFYLLSWGTLSFYLTPTRIS
ncbi:MAG TPA: NB-ARC domain-containing protein [Verrucomicrobiae bacterium]|nr:NB-ARC domain-containing protein [Verrucomicrobiae bacterium]